MKKFLLTLNLFALCITTVFSQIPAFTPTNGLIGYWPLNNNADDANTNNLDGISVNVSSINDRLGNANSAYSFNGTNSLITIPSPSAFLPNPDFTLSCWIKAPATGGNGRIIGRRWDVAVPYGYIEWALRCESDTIRFAASLQGGGGPVYFGGYEYVTIPNINDNTWHFVTITYQGTNLLKAYADGKLVNQKTIAANCINTAIDGLLKLGESYNGSLDEVGYNHFALNDCEIAKMYLNSEVILLQPQNSSGPLNGSAQITIGAATGATYQWQTDNGTGFTNITNAGQYSGVNTNTLNVSNLSISNNNNQQFKCIVNFGECPTTSDAAVLTVTDPSSIEEESNTNQFSVYPNPASSNATINVNPKMINSTYVILNANGKEVMSGTIKKEITNIDLSSFSSGVYTVQIAGKLNKKIIVTK